MKDEEKPLLHSYQNKRGLSFMSEKTDASMMAEKKGGPLPGEKRDVNVLRVRLVSTLVPIFAMSVMTSRDSLTSQYLAHRLGGPAGLNLSDSSGCASQENDSLKSSANVIQSQVTQYQTYFGYSQCVPAFFICLFIGSYADYLGRRFLLLVPLFTTFLKMILTSLIIRFQLDLRFFYLAYGIDGLAGSWYAMYLAMFALTADISDSHQQRTFWIYLVSVASTVAEAATDIASGYMIGLCGFFPASLLLTGMCSVAFVANFFFLSETMPHPPAQKIYNPFFHFRRIFGFYLLRGSARTRVTYCLGMLQFVLVVATLLYLPSLDALYQMRQPFCWNSTLIGYYSSLRGAGAYLLGALMLRLLQRCLPSEKIALIGLTCQCAAFSLEAFVWKSWQFYLVPVIGSPGTPLTAIIRSILSSMSEPHMQGALFSSIAVVESLTGLVTAAGWNQIYSTTVSFMPGFVYLVNAGCCFAAFILFVVYTCVRQRPQLHLYSADVKVIQ